LLTSIACVLLLLGSILTWLGMWCQYFFKRNFKRLIYSKKLCIFVIHIYLGSILRGVLLTSNAGALLLLGSILTWLGMWCQPFLKEILRD
jgi:hypothetical protein